jgi:chromosome segregation ATPase
MDTLEQACARLEAAVERLGQAVEAGPRSRLRARIATVEGELAATTSERQKLREELGRLGAERDRLNALVSETQKRYAAAKVVSDAVATRLNQAIADVRSLVGG